MDLYKLDVIAVHVNSGLLTTDADNGVQWFLVTSQDLTCLTLMAAFEYIDVVMNVTLSILSWSITVSVEVV